ncbi:MAG TPA: type II toxin-antitoxin system death-on-curing family toxin [Alphaproteobacteria bacterium]|nr:type II toxin-antitoxin system death-on-curing family toxin [Alphaproteobacteria bacterium]
MAKEPVWVEKDAVLAIHDINIARHGGLEGVRDANLLESALSRPQNLFGYGSPDLFDLAASYAFGLARNHPFADANKRTAFVVMRLFLKLNGYALAAEKTERIKIMLALAEGKMTEAEFAAWLRRNSTAL